MATIGLSRPYIARYTNAGSSVSYAGGRLLGKATELNIELNDGESNVFYADNGPAESDDRFSGGTASISVDELRPQAYMDALGVTSEPISVEGVTTPGAVWLKHNNSQSIPYLGFGGIAKKQINNETKYVGIILHKIKFSNPNQSYTTQGETIEWQTPQLTAQIFRSDDPAANWNWTTSPLNSEDEADAAVRSILNISEASVTPTLSALTIGTQELSPAFASGTTAYTASTTNAGDAVTGTPSNPGDEVTVKVNGAELDNGGIATWVTGTNTVEVTCTNSGGAQITYIVTVSKSGT